MDWLELILEVESADEESIQQRLCILCELTVLSDESSFDCRAVSGLVERLW